MDEREIIKKHHQEMQKKGVIARLKNDPNSFKKMARKRWEDQEDIDLIIESE